MRIDTEIHDLGEFDPLAVYASLAGHFGGESVSLLESYAGPERDVRVSLLLIDPVLTVSIRGTRVELTGRPMVIERLAPVLAARGFVVDGDRAIELGARNRMWDLLRAVQFAFSVITDPDAKSFTFGFFGYLGYDVAWAIEDLPLDIERDGNLPDVVLSLNSSHLSIDPSTGKTKLVSHFCEGVFEPPARQEIADLVKAARPLKQEIPEVAPPSAVRTTVNRKDFLGGVAVAQDHIAAGDIYQVQLGHELRVDSGATPLDVYRRLRLRNPSPYMFLANAGGVTLVGASPEVCVRIDGRQVCIRPIAGTISRGVDAEEDALLAAKLLSDSKEVAEHVMLIDLARNDVAHVSKPKTLDVDELMVIEQYSHVSHMVSNVIGELRDDVDAFDAFASGFPAGTVTGAPKIRAMEIIESLETTHRSWYGGAVGLIDFSGYTVTALTLRSTALADGTYHLRASAGIVADSIAENEWMETLGKLGAPFWAVTGMEVTDAITRD